MEPPHIVSHRDYDIVVQPEQNEFGAWRATVSVRHGSDAAEYRPEAVQPEWRTHAEALRDGLEWGIRFIDRKLASSKDEL